MKAAKKIVLKQILFLCTLAQTLPVLAVRPIMAKAGVGAVAALAAANVGRSYERKQIGGYFRSEEERRAYAGGAAVIGLGTTAGAAFFLHKRLPTQRLKQAADLRISVRDWRMMNPCSFTNARNDIRPHANIPLGSDEGKALFYEQLERYYRDFPFEYDEARRDFLEKSNALREAKKLTSQAQTDFEADNNQEGVRACQLELSEQNNLVDSVAERTLLIKAHPKFAKQVRDAQVVAAAKKQASAAEDAANNTSVIAAASVVSAFNSFGKK